MPGQLLNLFDYEARACEIMPKPVLDMVRHGSFDEVTARRIRPAFDSVLLRPRMLRNVMNRELSTTVLGQKISFPVMSASPGRGQYADPDGEFATARAAAAVGTVMVRSHFSKHGLEDMAESANGPRWFQLYVYPDRELTKECIQRAEAAGYSAVVLTVGAPPAQEDTRNNLVDLEVTPENPVRRNPDGGLRPVPELADFDPSITWSILEWIRAVTSLPIVVKGVMSPHDARLAVENGALGVMVSNPAARPFDGPITAIEALSYVVDAVGGRCEVYLDGGVRRGIDVLKALALGARACLIGTPLCYALAVDGEKGVRHIFEILKNELDLAMAMCGTRTIDDIDRSLVTRPELGAF